METLPCQFIPKRMIFNFQVDLIERECSELMLEAGYQFKKNHKRPKQENESEEKEGKKEKVGDNKREKEEEEEEVMDGYGHE